MEDLKDIEYVMRRSIVEPTVFVLSVDKNGRPSGMSAGWNMKVSYEPPMIAVALHDTNNTQALILESKEFVVSVPSPELRESLEFFGSVNGKEVDKFKHTGIKTKPGKTVRTPILADARINFECKLHSYSKPADHYVFFGEVTSAHLDESREQLFYAGRDGSGRVFKSVKTDPPVRSSTK